MRQLNKSLADIKAVKTQMAGLESITNSYDDQLRIIKESIGGVRQENKEMKDSVDAAVNTAAGFKVRGMIRLHVHVFWWLLYWNA